MQLAFLWTDLLVYMLCLSVFSFAWYARKKEYLLAPWKQVVRSRLGVMALIILMTYVAIGLLDSVHFKLSLDAPDKEGDVVYSSEVISLFDWLANPIRLAQEKTYSAPFATHLFSKETIELPNGKQTRAYPRLVYGGAHLDDPAQKWDDVLQIALVALIKGVMIWVFLCLCIVFILANRYKKSALQILAEILRGKANIPWRTVLATIGIIVVLLTVVISFSAKYHLFGTDKVGQDVFYQTIKSIRTGLVIGTLTTLIMLPFAVMLGIMAGYFRGWVDDVIQYLYTTLSSIPGVLLITAAILISQVYMSNNPDAFGESLTERADVRLLILCIILGITSWTGLCRLLRAETLKLRELDYVQASTAFGVNNFVIILRHILPNVMHIVLISVVLDFSGLVLAEAVLSYVGVGVDPSMISWGNMINSARLEMAREPMVWWSLVAAFIFMFILVLAANLFSDAVRDAFDPRLRSAR